MRIQHHPGIEPILDALEAAASELGVRALLVGGYVRDRLLGRDCKDVDVVAEGGLALELADAVATRLNARPPVVFERFGTAQLSAEGFLVEFVSARAERYDPDSRKPEVRPGTLEEDIIRRDFTCNTLLADRAGEVLDLTGKGVDDIETRILRTPLPAMETFSEDPLRAMRAIRFSVQLDFAMHEDIPPAIQANVDRLMSVVSMERINDELRKMLLSPRPGEAMRLLRANRVLARLMPDVDAMAGVEQTGFHTHDVLEHTLLALDSVAARGERFDDETELILRFSVLLHDAGKPETQVHEDDERITFIGHPEAGARIAFDLLRRLRFSNDLAEKVAHTVSMHMRPIQYSPGEWSDGAVRRLVRDAGDTLQPLLEVAVADMGASDFPPEEAERKLGDLRRRIESLDVESVRRISSPLNGHQLMERYQRPAGAWLRHVQDGLVEAVLDGELAPGDEAAAWSYLEAHPELVS